jgi:glycosyltransferase involved in cell wall biosynthesis
MRIPSPPLNGHARHPSLVTPPLLPTARAGGSPPRAAVHPRSSASDLVCLSHLRWDFVFQRPQHLLTRFSRERRVFYVEEPQFGGRREHLVVSRREHGLHVVTPHLPAPSPEAGLHARLRTMIDRLFSEQRIADHLLWFYTPMAMPYTNHLTPQLVVYDCMDELSAFAGAPPAMREREAQLLAWADLVFTGGQSLYEAKRGRHPRVHAFPSSIDQHHFCQARARRSDPPDQAAIPHPRLGFFGVVDERFDVQLIEGVARARPDWQIVILGPVVKIDPATLPRLANVHYLGQKAYADLPRYLGGWDVALLPFAHNASTRFISPTKTPEYLSAGCPVVSTAITDVVRPYGELKLVHIADGVADFCSAIAAAFADVHDPAWQLRVRAALRGNSWDRTWMEMRGLMEEAARSKGHDLSRCTPAASTPD